MKRNKTGGFITKIVLIIIALIALKYYFHFDVLEWLKSQEGQKIIGPLITFTKNFYNYLDYTQFLKQ